MNKIILGVFHILVIFCFAAMAHADDDSISPDDPALDRLSDCDASKIEYKKTPATLTYNYSELRQIGAGPNWKWVSTAWPKGAKDVNDLLTNLSATVVVDSIEGNVKAGATLFKASAKGKNLRYTLDFMKFRNEPVLNNDVATPKKYIKVGVGLRLEIEINQWDGDIGTGLVALAVEANARALKGKINIEVVGISSDALTAAIPVSTDLSEGGIQTVIESLGIIRAKLSDPNTKLTPNKIANIECKT